MQKKLIKTDLSLLSEIINDIRGFDVIGEVSAIRKAAEKAESGLNKKGSEIKAIETKISKAKQAMKELGVDTKELQSYESMLANQKSILSKLLKGVAAARFIDNV